MKSFFVFIFLVLSTLLWAATEGLARKAPEKKQYDRYQIHINNPASDRPLDAAGLHATAVVETFVLAEFTFDEEGCGCKDPQGWYGVDLTAQSGTYFHMDDFEGLGGGFLVPLEGNQSLWCGARPDLSSPILCNYATLPGYGNNWDQRFESVDFSIAGDVTFSFKVSYDTEAYVDYTDIQYQDKDDKWITLLTLDGFGSLIVNEVIPQDSLDGSVKFRFRFVSDGAWSDEDGINDSDGAVIIDSLLVADTTGILDYHDFESEAVGDKATNDGDWMGKPGPSYGDFSGLFNGTAVLQEDPCERNVSHLWGFFKGSTYDYSCGGHPEQAVVPYGEEREDRMFYIWNEIWSPMIDWTHDIHGTPVPSTADVACYEFDVYRNLPMNPLVFYYWHVRSLIDGCPRKWKDRGLCEYGPGPDWYHYSAFIGDLVDPLAEQVQLALAAFDMCGIWCNMYGTGECHTHAPLFDNVRLIRLNITGPRWSVRDIDLFQDTFPENGTSVGTGRIDMALDILPVSNPNIHPGDSAKVSCSDPVFGLREPEPFTGFGSAVYFYLSIFPQNQAGKMAPSEIEEDSFRWPLVDSTFCNGIKWYQFRCDTVFFENYGPRTGQVFDSWCIDINDHCFTNGDTLYFFFGAGNSVGDWTYWGRDGGTVATMEEACKTPMEMQILPGAGAARGGEILYVDYFSGRGAQPYFDSAFHIMGIYDLVDRFDKRGPSSLVGNGIGYQVRSVLQQLVPIYRIIIWNSGDLSFGTVGDGSGNPYKEDDFSLLDLFLSQHTSPLGAGIYFSGDDMAEEWVDLGLSAQAFRNKYIPYTLITGNHTELHCICPYGIGMSGLMFVHGDPLVSDTLICDGSCPAINDFDVIQPLPPSVLEMAYDGEEGNPSVISCTTLNDLGNPAVVALSGFSFHYIRDDHPAAIPDRVHHLTDIIRFFSGLVPDLTPVDPALQFINSLAQNYPNPFNPSTTIKYSIKERANVSLKIYNVAGQLVKTLVNEEKDPRLNGYTVIWDGCSNAGERVSSGVYFYRLVTAGFTQTKKMLVLK